MHPPVHPVTREHRTADAPKPTGSGRSALREEGRARPLRVTSKPSPALGPPMNFSAHAATKNARQVVTLRAFSMVRLCVPVMVRTGGVVDEPNDGKNQEQGQRYPQGQAVPLLLPVVDNLTSHVQLPSRHGPGGVKLSGRSLLNVLRPLRTIPPAAHTLSVRVEARGRRRVRHDRRLLLDDDAGQPSSAGHCCWRTAAPWPPTERKWAPLEHRDFPINAHSRCSLTKPGPARPPRLRTGDRAC